MAKKKKDEEAVQGAAPELKEVLPAVVERPAMLEPVVKEYGLELADAKVNQHLVRFTPFVADLVAMETELNELLTGEITPELTGKAKELRDKYRGVRLASESAKTEDKREMVVEGRFLDKLNGVIAEAAKVKEAKCLEIEKHVENLEKKAKDELLESRRAILDELAYDHEFLPLGDMPEESFNRLVEKAKGVKAGAEALAIVERQKKEQADAEAKRLQEEKDKVNARVARLNAIGLVLNTETRNFTGEHGRVDVDVVEFMDDKTFEEHFNKAKVKYDEAEQAKADALASQQRITNRMTALSNAGLTYNPVAERFEGWGETFALNDINTLDAQGFSDKLDLVRGNVLDAKKKQADEQKKKDDALKKLQDEANQRKAAELKKQEEAKALELAPDKEKFKIFYAMLRDLRAPEFKTAEGVAVGLSIGSHLTTLLKAVKGEAQRLV